MRKIIGAAVTFMIIAIPTVLLAICQLNCSNAKVEENSQPSDNKLSDRFIGADAVVVGKVFFVEKYLLLPTEQKADWRVAIVDITRNLKGSVILNGRGMFHENLANIYFPGSWESIRIDNPKLPLSMSHYWGTNPKFSVSQEGIFALRTVDEKLDLYKYDYAAMTALDVYDFQPLCELEHIQQLLKVR